VSISLLQLGSAFFIKFPREILEPCIEVGEDGPKVSLLLIKTKAREKMGKLENELMFSRVNRSIATVVVLGNAEELLGGAKDGDIEINLEGEALIAADIWKAIIFVKLAQEEPITSEPVIYAFANLERPIEKKIEKHELGRRIKLTEEIEDQMRLSTTWKRGLRLEEIRSIVKAKERHFDVDGSKTIEIEEFQNALENLGLYLSEHRIQFLFKSCDLDGNRTVEISELADAIFLNDHLSMRRRVSPKDAFELFDFDESGELSTFAAFEAMNMLCNSSISRHEFDKAINLGRNEGKLNYEQFLKTWFKFCKVDQELRRVARDRHAAARHLSNEGESTLLASEKEFELQMEKKLKWGFSKRVTELERLLKEEEAEELKQLQEARKNLIQESHRIRLQKDMKKKEDNAIKRRERVAAKLSLSIRNRNNNKEKHSSSVQHEVLSRRQNELRKRLETEIGDKKNREYERRQIDKAIRRDEGEELRSKSGNDRISIEGQKLREIPLYIFKSRESQRNLVHLVVLNLSHNSLESLPERGLFFWCGALRKLDISFNHLKKLPPDIGVLSSLEIFIGEKNLLRGLPVEFVALSSLKFLNLAENKLELLPERFQGLRNLRKLQLQRNRFEYFPSQVGRLENLEYLDMSLNEMLGFGTGSVEDLGHLKFLDLSRNTLEYICAALGSMKELEHLSLTSNELRSLPKGLGDLKSLKHLHAARNRLMELPKCIENLSCLISLDLSHNKISKLPGEIGSCHSLQQINLHGNNLKSIPRELGLLKKLLDLRLMENKIPQIPYEVGGMSRICSLDLSRNSLQKILDSVGALQSLKTLILKDNNLTWLPQSIGFLANLTRLDLSGNQLTDLCESFVNMRNLEKLDCSRNKIKNLPKMIGDMATLKEIHVAGNMLEFLPAEISDLERLTTLDVSSNRLKSLPVQLGRVFSKLSTFRAEHNPFSLLPIKFVEYRSNEVAAWVMQNWKVFDACERFLDENLLFAENPETRLRYKDFLGAVVETVRPWNEEFERAVKKYFFEAKRQGVRPRWDALYDEKLVENMTKISARQRLIASRNHEAKELQHAREAEESCVLEQEISSFPNVQETLNKKKEQRLEADLHHLLDQVKQRLDEKQTEASD